MKLYQGFSALALLTFWVGYLLLLVGAALSIVGCLAASLPLPTRCWQSTPTLSHDTRNVSIHCQIQFPQGVTLPLLLLRTIELQALGFKVKNKQQSNFLVVWLSGYFHTFKAWGRTLQTLGCTAPGSAINFRLDVNDVLPLLYQFCTALHCSFELFRISIVF